MARQQLQPAVLEDVGVLELVDQDVTEALLVVAAQRLVARQQFVAAQQQFGEIDHALLLALGLVGFVEADALAGVVVPGLDGRRPQPGFLLAVDEVLKFARRELFVIDIQRFSAGA